jgi:EmrB/QacA subfamily drug resistance transporter
LFIVGLDATIVNVALPSIQRNLNASVSGLQWTIDAYTLVLASLLMLSGSTADRFGRRRIFQLGLGLFTLGSLLCSVAPGLEWLVVFRIVQAVGGSMLNPVALSIITNTITDRRERARALGIWGAVFGLSLALGPVLGGVLVSTIGWRAIFWINVPVGIAAIVLAQCFVPESRAPRARRFDPPGQALVITMLATLTYALIEGPHRGWGSALIVSLFAVSFAAAATLVVVESRRDQPLLDVRFFRSAPFSGATLIAVAAFAAFGGFLFLNSLYLQDVRGFTALHAGLLTLPMAGMIALFAHAIAPGRAGHSDRRPAAGAARSAHLRRLPGPVLRHLRYRSRLRQRADLQHRGVRHACRAGRGGRGRRLHQPPGRRHARCRDRRGPRGRRHRCRLHRREPRRLGRHRRLRRRDRVPGVRLHRPVGRGHRGTGPAQPGHGLFNPGGAQ